MAGYNFKEGFNTGMSYLKRRFSSNDLQGDLMGDKSADIVGFSFNFPRRKGPSPSAPSSPSRSTSIQGITKSLFGSSYVQGSKQPAYNKDRCKILFVIDLPNIEWSKYFRDKKLHGYWDIRVEQAEFSEVNLSAYSDKGVVVDIQVTRNGSKVVRSFTPDFVLVRQHVKDANEDWKNLIIGLQYGGVASINSFYSIYNFLDKPWVFANLVEVRRKLGKETFPLIEQTYYPDHQEMSTLPTFPVVVKIGHAHSGLGTVKIDNNQEYQDMTSLVALAGSYCVTEPFIDSKYDIHIQKIGSNYRSFIRTSISGNWKVNTGSSMLEQIPTNERYKKWVDECASLFDGMDIVAVQAVMGKDNNEYILEINDCTMPLLGETQEEDRGLIGNLVLSRMQELFKAEATQQSSAQSDPTVANSMPMAGAPGPPPHMSFLEKKFSSAVESIKPEPKNADEVVKDLEDNDDTMKNLRNTFAGIFGNM